MESIKIFDPENPNRYTRLKRNIFNKFYLELDQNFEGDRNLAFKRAQEIIEKYPPSNIYLSDEDLVNIALLTIYINYGSNLEKGWFELKKMLKNKNS